MNRTVIIGTPRMTSMKPTDSARTIGSCDRRPSARSTPAGNEKTMPDSAMISVTRMPPQKSVETRGRPSVVAPCSNRKAAIG